MAASAGIVNGNLNASISRLGAHRLGITYNAGTGLFSVTGSNGSALSNSNIGYISIPSKSAPGRILNFALTADQAFIDDNGSSEIIGNLFGHTTGRATTQDIPFFIYAVLNDAETALALMCCRVSHLQTSPAAANIGQPGSAIADLQNDFFSFDTITATDYDANPCVCIGCFRMRMSASDDWTVQTLASSDGIGKFYDGVYFTQAVGHYGADASVYTIANGGTAATFSSINVQYMVNRDGTCNYIMSYSGDGGTDGSGAVTAFFACVFAGPNVFYTGGFFTTALGAASTPALFLHDSSDHRKIGLLNAGPYLWSAFTNGGRQVLANFIFPIQAS